MKPRELRTIIVALSISICVLFCVIGLVIAHNSHEQTTKSLEDCNNGTPYVMSEPKNYEVRNGTVYYEGELQKATETRTTSSGFTLMFALFIIVLLMIMWIYIVCIYL